MEYDLDIILPMYNPLPGWENTVLQACEKIRTLAPALSFRIILVNDGSKVGTFEQGMQLLKATLPDFRPIHCTENRGKGSAVREGARAAEAPVVIFTDIDFPYLEKDLLEVYREVRDGKADLVLSRRNPEYYRQAPWMRELISRLLKFTVKSLFRIPTADTQGGLKGFSPNGLEVLKQTRVDRYLFDLELVKRAARAPDVKMTGLPARLKPEVAFSPVRFSILARESLNLIRILFLRP